MFGSGLCCRRHMKGLPRPWVLAAPWPRLLIDAEHRVAVGWRCDAEAADCTYLRSEFGVGTVQPVDREPVYRTPGVRSGEPDLGLEPDAALLRVQRPLRSNLSGAALGEASESLASAAAPALTQGSVTVKV